MTLAIHVGLILVVLSAFASRFGVNTEKLLSLTAISFDPPQEPPRPPPPQQQRPSKATAGRAAPANITSKASPVFAPKLPPIALPPPIAAAPSPAQGAQSESGASDKAGPGTGAGGTGNGNGSGGDGTGTGSGGSPPVMTGGRIGDGDIPKGVRDQPFEGNTLARLTIGTNGRVSDCVIQKSSGNGTLDDTTCPLIRQRFRFRPAKDGNGKPVASQVVYGQHWTITGQWDQ